MIGSQVAGDKHLNVRPRCPESALNHLPLRKVVLYVSKNNLILSHICVKCLLFPLFNQKKFYDIIHHILNCSVKMQSAKNYLTLLDSFKKRMCGRIRYLKNCLNRRKKYWKNRSQVSYQIKCYLVGFKHGSTGVRSLLLLHYIIFSSITSIKSYMPYIFGFLTYIYIFLISDMWWEP